MLLPDEGVKLTDLLNALFGIEGRGMEGKGEDLEAIIHWD
jgi:hypothetical protein